MWKKILHVISVLGIRREHKRHECNSSGYAIVATLENALAHKGVRQSEVPKKYVSAKHENALAHKARFVNFFPFTSPTRHL